MNNPDFSQSPEHVALAKVLLEANETHNRWNHMPLENLAESSQRHYLAMADAAITHLGSGYRLPEATDANAERLMESILSCDTNLNVGMEIIYALHAAFAEPAEPTVAKTATVPCPAMNGDNPCEQIAGHDGPHSQGNVEWEDDEPEGLTGCDPTDCDICQAEQLEPAKPRDIIGESERRKERQRMVWELVGGLARSVSNNGKLVNIVAGQAVAIAEEYTDAYLAWRDADEAAAKERICRK